MVRLNLAHMPAQSTWKHIIGVSLLAGIGFTMSIFVTDLAFTNEVLVGTAKLSMFIASVLSGPLGILVLRNVRKSR